MKKINLVAIVLIMLLGIFTTYAQTHMNVNQQGTGNLYGNPVEQRAQNMTNFEEMFEHRMTEQHDSFQHMENNQMREMYQNQSRIEMAGYVFQAAAPLTGEHEREFYNMGFEIQNTAKNSLRAEEQIRERNQFVRFLIGGNRDAALNLSIQTNQYREQIQEVNRLRQECNNCSQELDNMFQEQIRNMEQEQIRLEKLAQDELERKGIFGWIWK